LANAPVVLLTSLAVYAAIPMILLDFVSPPLAALYAVCVESFVRWSIEFAQWFSRLPFATATVSITLGFVGAFYFAVVAALQLQNPKTRAKWGVAALLALNFAVWIPRFKPEPEKPFLIFSALGRSTAVALNIGEETLVIDGGSRDWEWARIEAQLNQFELKPTALIQFSNGDSAIQARSVQTKILRTDSLVQTKTWIMTRPSIEHCRIYTKCGALVCSMFLENLNAESFFKSDVLYLQLRRFGENERRKLESWLSSSTVKLAVAELSPFMARAERKHFYRYAKGEARIKTTERDGQLVLSRFH
jgi:competence protein ComEC